MKITDVFPALEEKPEHLPRKRPSWTKRGPGRRHNSLTKREQDSKDKMMFAGLSATEALRELGKIV